MKRLSTHDGWLKGNLWVKLLRCTRMSAFDPIYEGLWLRLHDSLGNW